MGSSVGGALALLMCLREPDRFSKLVLVDSAGLGRKLSLYVRLVSLPLLGQILESTRVGGTKYMLYNVFEDQSFVTDELLEDLYRSRKMPGAKEAVVRTVQETVNLFGVRSKWVLLDALKSLKVPLLLVWGDQDRILPVSQAYAAAEAAPDATLKVFDACGHWPHMERSPEFNELLLDFLLT